MDRVSVDFSAELAALEQRSLLRTLRNISGPQASTITVDHRAVLNFSSNNYLGLANHPALIAAATEAMAQEGFGAGGSRLIVGNLDAHRRLEEQIASWKRTEAALVFNSGYQANLGILTALAGPEDLILSDELNHASLIDGARLSRATVRVFAHCDPEQVGRTLAEARSYRRRFIITDALFSMDGDRAPLDELCRLAHRYDALTVVDEAHSIGVLGEQGAGLCLDRPIDLQIGTFSKALGGFGGFVAARRPIIDLLLNRARSFVFSTALPVPVIAAAQAAITLVASDEGDRLRAQLHRVVDRFSNGLDSLNIPVPKPRSYILPVAVGDDRRTMHLSEELLRQDVFAQGIRPPTVPAGTARLRFSLMATHTDAQIDAALAALRTVGAGR